jgi:hypothetical protein
MGNLQRMKMGKLQDMKEQNVVCQGLQVPQLQHWTKGAQKHVIRNDVVE